MQTLPYLMNLYDLMVRYLPKKQAIRTNSVQWRIKDISGQFCIKIASKLAKEIKKRT